MQFREELKIPRELEGIDFNVVIKEQKVEIMKLNLQL